MSGIEISCIVLWWAARIQNGGVICDAPLPVLDQYGVWHVLWSMHASLSEQESLVAWVRPARVQAICKSLVDNRSLPDLSRFIARLANLPVCELSDLPVSELSDPNVSPPSLHLTALSEEMRRSFAFQPLPDGTLTDLLADTLPVDALAVTSPTTGSRLLHRAPSNAATTEIDSQNESDSQCSPTVAKSEIVGPNPLSQSRSLRAHSTMDSSDSSMPIFSLRKKKILSMTQPDSESR